MSKWIKRISYNDGGRIAAGFKSSASGDCVVRAISILNGNNYMATRMQLAKVIERERGVDRSNVESGVYERTYKKFLHTMGVKTYKRTTCWTKIPTDRRVLVVMREHVVAYIGGVINDTFDPVSQEVCGPLLGYYEFGPIA